MPRDHSKFFFTINGREVFDNGLTKRWRCPECKWWREWDDEVCCVCKTARDGPSNGKSGAVAAP